MLSESARATAASESRFRINYPNSRPRSVQVVALDTEATALLRGMSEQGWERASLSTAASPGGSSSEGTPGNSLNAWPRDLLEQGTNFLAKVAAADVMVMLVRAGSDARAAIPIGEACAIHGVPTIGLVLQDKAEIDEGTMVTLKFLRPITTMLVIAAGEEFVEAMLIALRA